MSVCRLVARIPNIAQTIAEPSAKFPVSSALRAALAGFTKLYADQYGKANIRINNLLPGFVDSYDVDVQTKSTIPMARSGTIQELAKTVAFLVSDDASYITGQNIRMDGGLARSI